MRDIQASPGEEIELTHVLLAMWRGRFFISAVTLFFATLTIVFALNKPNIYTSRAVLVPAQSSSDGMSGLGQLSGLMRVTMAGGVAGNSARSTAEGLAMLDSRKFFYDFIEKHQLYDASAKGQGLANSDKEDEEIFDAAAHASQNSKEKLSAYLRLKGAVSFTKDSATGFITLSVTDESPTTAKNILDWLIEDINQAVKDRKISEANHAIEYLRLQSNSTGLAELRLKISDLIQKQVEVVMLATTKPDFVFQVLDPSHIPEVPSAPNRRLYVVVGTLAGFCLGVFFWMTYILIVRLRRIT
jgi:uncharacterized protein involved in exopolysaccharide biosynthesis